MRRDAHSLPTSPATLATPQSAYELETLILQATNPPYNVKIPRES
jgi:hypothetical protein